MKRFDDIIVFYNYCADIINENITSIQSLTTNEKITYFRNFVENTILNTYFIVGEISENIKHKINANTKIIKLSVDSMIKNILEHPEINIKEYNDLHNYINNSEYILKKNNKNLIYFKIDNKIYQFVIKRTQNGNELFITTFHKASLNQLNKDINRYEILNKKDSSDYEDSKYPSVT